MGWGKRTGPAPPRGVLGSSSKPTFTVPSAGQFVYRGKTYNDSDFTYNTGEGQQYNLPIVKDESGKIIGVQEGTGESVTTSRIIRPEDFADLLPKQPITTTPSGKKSPFGSGAKKPSTPWGELKYRKVPSEWTDLPVVYAEGNPGTGDNWYERDMLSITNQLVQPDEKVAGKDSYTLVKMYEDEYTARLQSEEIKKSIAASLEEAKKVKAEMELSRKRDLDAKVQRATSYQKTASNSRALLAGAAIKR